MLDPRVPSVSFNWTIGKIRYRWLIYKAEILLTFGTSVLDQWSGGGYSPASHHSGQDHSCARAVRAKIWCKSHHQQLPSKLQVTCVYFLSDRSPSASTACTIKVRNRILKCLLRLSHACGVTARKKITVSHLAPLRPHRAPEHTR
ncbi:hypothetical protein PILCRDRAFT_635755 [Piloderma croceum F 1598]|uniref:Uncharacterized protein n=1 Tax=Piloderma croceum (strain F 1598) TaxID=765440 RepID=A0A0C3ASM8_PILCF|nr:hypothetical protein PILCRDRAFT_635755 [Piloderma croceum F 1598]